MIARSKEFDYKAFALNHIIWVSYILGQDVIPNDNPPKSSRFFLKCFAFFPLHQILCNLLAVDGVNEPDVLAINGGKYKNKY